MIDIATSFKVAEIAINAMSSIGIGVVVKDIVKEFTPEGLSATKKVCVKVAGMTLTGGVSGFVARETHRKLEKTQKKIEEAVQIFTNDQGERVIDATYEVEKSEF